VIDELDALSKSITQHTKNLLNRTAWLNKSTILEEILTTLDRYTTNITYFTPRNSTTPSNYYELFPDVGKILFENWLNIIDSTKNQTFSYDLIQKEMWRTPELAEIENVITIPSKMLHVPLFDYKYL